MRRLIFSFLISSFAIVATAVGASPGFTPEYVLKRVNAHLVIGDHASACSEAVQGLQRYPQFKGLWQVYINALAASGDERAMLAAWKKYGETFPDDAQNRDLLECVAWAVIHKGADSSSPITRVMAMLGAFFSQDAKGIIVLQKGLQDQNSFLRGAAVKLSSHLMDASLRDELIILLKQEKVWRVRLEVIEAVGKLKIPESKSELKKIIADDKCHMEEKAAAIEALVTLTDGIDRGQLMKLVSSDRAGVRMLACEFVAFFDQEKNVDLLKPLINDPHAEVRSKVLETFGRLRVSEVSGKPVADLAAQMVSDPDPTVAVTAAWVLTINRPEQGMKTFEKFLNHQVRETRHLAAAALAATGKYGVPLSRKVFRSHSDPYVRMNLALGLIGQRVETKEACDHLFAGLSQQRERWAWEDHYFRVLTPSKVKHDDAIPNYPEAVNQLTRLEVLQALAVVQYPGAQQAVKNFLKESQWGISGLASALLLTEGDDDAVDLVRNLLKDADPKVRVQAALILALWGEGDDVVQLLQGAYTGADRDMKEQILEGVGRIGSQGSLLFLSERLQEPYQTIRIISAAALLECLYH